MIRHAMFGMMVFALAGCQHLGLGPRAESPERARLVADISRIDYPAEAEAQEVPVAAILSDDGQTLRIINFSDDALPEVYVWVNRAFVTRVASIPPQGTVTLATNRFFDRAGRSLAAQNVQITRVQIQLGEDELYNLLGPAREGTR
jgi:hypothetical protein